MSYPETLRRRWPVLVAILLLALAAVFGAKLLVGQGAAEEIQASVPTREGVIPVDAGHGAVDVPATLGESLDLANAKTAVQIGSTRFVVAPGVSGASVGSQSLSGKTCFAMIAEGAGSQFGCNPASSVSRDGLGFSFTAPDGSVVGAVLLPENYRSVAINGTPADAPDGIVSYSAGKDELVVITADGPGGPITRTP